MTRKQPERNEVAIFVKKNIEKIDSSCKKLEGILPDAGEKLRSATLALRDAFSVGDTSIYEFRQLRRSIVGDANAYRFQILPVAKWSTTSVKGFMNNFTDRSMPEILDIAGDLSKDAQTGRDLMVICRDLHKEVCSCFKRQQDKIDKVLARCEMEKRLCLKRAEEEKAWASWHSGWAFGLAFIPVVNIIATPILANEACHNDARSLAAQSEAQLATNATIVIRDCLVTALGQYVEAMDLFAATFQLLADDINQFLQPLA
jgi:hypothetical protein